MTPEEKALDNRARKVRAAIGAQMRAEKLQAASEAMGGGAIASRGAAPRAGRIKAAPRGSMTTALLDIKQELDSSYEEVEVEARQEGEEAIDGVDPARAPRKKRWEMTPEEKRADNRNRKAREAFRLERERAEAYGGALDIDHPKLWAGRPAKRLRDLTDEEAPAPKRSKALAHSSPASVPMAAVPLASLVGKKAAAMAERAGAVGLVPLSAVRNLRPGGRQQPYTIFASPQQLPTGPQRRGLHGPSAKVVQSLAQAGSLPRKQPILRLQPKPPKHPPPIVPPESCEAPLGSERSSRKRRFEMTREEKSADNRARKARAVAKTAEKRAEPDGMLV